MKRLIIYLFSLSVIVLYFGCTSSVNIENIDVIYEDYQSYKAPTTGDTPGKIYFLDEDNVRFDVVSLNDVTIRTDTIQLPRIKVHTKAKTFFGFLSGSLLSSINLDFSSTFNNEKDYDFTFEVTGSIREYTEENDVKSKIQELFNSKKLNKDTTYFIIRDAIKVKSIRYTIDEVFKRDIGGDVKVQELTKLNSNISYSGTTASSIIQTFNQPYRIFYKPQAIKHESGLTGSKVILKDIDNNILVSWKSTYK